MVFYLYTNMLGTYLMDSKAAIVKKTLFKDPSAVYMQLSQNMLLNEEKNLIASLKEDVITFLIKENHKISNLKNANFSDAQTMKIFEKISTHFSGKDYHSDFIKNNQKILSDQLRDAPSQDPLIIQAVNTLDDTLRIANMLSTRLREWYSWFYPELALDHDEAIDYAKKVLKTKKPADSIGVKLTKEDLSPIMDLAEHILKLDELQNSQIAYIENVMQTYCPNTSAVATELVAARLLALAGGLRQLMLFPSSTIQTLGAEKAMFRHLKTGDRPPKYGIIILHPLIARTKKSDKGRVARALASKISLAVKMDFFKGETYKGYELKEELEKKFGSYDTDKA